MVCDAERGCRSAIPPQTPTIPEKRMPLLTGVEAWAYYVCLLKPDLFVPNSGYWMNMNGNASMLQRASELIRECNGNHTQLIFRWLIFRSTFRLGATKKPSVKRIGSKFLVIRPSLHAPNEEYEPLLRSWVESKHGISSGWQWQDLYTTLRRAKCSDFLMYDNHHFSSRYIPTKGCFLYRPLRVL